MLIDDVTSSGAMPALEMMMRFSGARNRVLAHNIANLDTPDFRPMDVSPGAFQAQLRKAVDERRSRTGGMHGQLPFEGSKEVGVGAGGEIRLAPRTPSGNILFHDRNNRDMERTVQSLAENVQVFRLSSDLLRSKYETLKLAMNER
jgi:flagellar basal-body rod protein FlgB